VVNRRGLAKALHLTGFEVEAVTPNLIDRYPRQPDKPLAPVARAMRVTGLRGPLRRRTRSPDTGLIDSLQGDRPRPATWGTPTRVIPPREQWTRTDGGASVRTWACDA